MTTEEDESLDLSEEEIKLAEKFSMELTNLILKYGIVFKREYTPIALASSLITHLCVVGGGDKESFITLLGMYWDLADKKINGSENE